MTCEISASPNRLPFSLRGYEFIQVLGSGGFSQVFLVRSIKFQLNFVAKVVTLDPDDMSEKKSTIESEINSLKILNHRNIIKLFDYFTEGLQTFLILEYCPNGTLLQEVLKRNPHGLEYSQFVKISKQLIEAVKYFHGLNIAHRDIKPENVFFGENNIVKFADFGLSISLNSENEHINKFGGSTIYSSPEIHNKKPHNPIKADIWALGVTFSVMLCGDPPFLYDTVGMMKKSINSGKLVFNKRIPPEMISLIRSMLNIDPDKRPSISDISNNPIFNFIEYPVSNPIQKRLPPLKWSKIYSSPLPKSNFEMFNDLPVKRSVHIVTSWKMHKNKLDERQIPSRVKKLNQISARQSLLNFEPPSLTSVQSNVY